MKNVSTQREDIDDVTLETIVLDPPKSSLREYNEEKELQASLSRRETFITGKIYLETIWDTVDLIQKCNREDKANGIPPEFRKPIFLHIHSGGGDVYDGDILISYMLNSKTPIYTINDSFAASMAGLIYLAGHKRFAFARSKLMLHAGSLYLQENSDKVEDFMEFNRKCKEIEAEFISKHSKLSVLEYKSYTRADWYTTAHEAKELGMVDFIIGEDCDLDDILPIDEKTAK